MTREQLELAGMALFGQRWQSDIARALRVTPRQARRWIAGDAGINDRYREEIIDICIGRARHLTQIAERLRRAP